MFTCHVVYKAEGGGHHSSAYLYKIYIKIGVILACNFNIYFLISVNYRSTALTFLPLLCYVSRLRSC